jgi:hypothetical protein
MPTPPAGFAQVNISYNQELLGQVAEVTFGLDATAFDTALANAILDAWQTQFAPVCFNGHTIGPCEIRTSDNLVFTSSDPAVGGTGGSPGASSQVAYLIRKITNLGGRRNRGRWFLPGVVEGEVNSGGFLDSGIVVALETACDDFAAALGLLDATVYLLHSDGGPPTEVTSYQVAPQVATQRRRLGR